MTQEVGLLGSGAQADEIESYLEDGQTVVFRAVSPSFVDPNNPLSLNIEEARDRALTPVVVAVGAPAVKRDLVKQWPGRSFLSVVSKMAYVDDSLVIGDGSVISPLAVVTTNVTIGQHVIVNIGVSISHDVHIGDFVTISPGAHIAGNVTIEDGVFIGIGAVISNNVSIAEGSVIGAGAVVLHNITEKNSVAVGVPAQVIKHNEGWPSEL